MCLNQLIVAATFSTQTFADFSCPYITLTNSFTYFSRKSSSLLKFHKVKTIKRSSIFLLLAEWTRFDKWSSTNFKKMPNVLSYLIGERVKRARHYQG